MKPAKKSRVIKLIINSDKMPNFEFDKNGQKLKISGIKKFENKRLNQVKTEILYERLSGKDKVIHTQYFERNALHFDFDQQLKNQYNIVYACDTNTRIIGGTKFSLGCLCILGFSETQFHFYPILAIAFSSRILDNINPERVAWKYFIKYTNTEEYKGSKICFFVDSELGKIDDINLGHIAIYENYYLPKNVTLTYASSDGGKEYVGNKLLSCADKASNELLDHLIENSFVFPSFREPKLFNKIPMR